MEEEPTVTTKQQEARLAFNNHFAELLTEQRTVFQTQNHEYCEMLRNQAIFVGLVPFSE